MQLQLEGLRFFIVHNKRDVPQKLTDVDIVVYGHSHKYEADMQDGVLWLNPGSCGHRRFNLSLSMCVLEVENGRYRVEPILIDSAYWGK